jgi:hypothetical protein
MSTSGKHIAKVTGALAAVAVVFASCLKTADLPVEPRITVKSIAQVNGSTQLDDTLTLTIGFTDGDGDIGLDDTYSAPPFDSASFYFNNLFFDPEKLVNGSWVPVPQWPYYYRVKVLTPGGQNKALDGEIAIALDGSFFPFPPILAGDTVRFRVRLFDRALHQSNELITESIMLH